MCVITVYVSKQKPIWSCAVTEHQSEQYLFDWRACEGTQASKASQLSSKLKGRAVARIKGPLRPMKHLRGTGSLHVFQASAFAGFYQNRCIFFAVEHRGLQGNDRGETLWYQTVGGKGKSAKEGEEKDKCFCRTATQSHVSTPEPSEKWKPRLPSHLQPLFSLLLMGQLLPNVSVHSYTDLFFLRNLARA